MTPPVKNRRDTFIIDLFRTPFSEKKDEWTKKIFQLKKFWKKIYGGVPRTTELGRNPKFFSPKISICRFTGISPYEKIKSI